MKVSVFSDESLGEQHLEGAPLDYDVDVSVFSDESLGEQPV